MYSKCIYIVDKLYSLAYGSDTRVMCYTACVMNRCRHHLVKCEEKRWNQKNCRLLCHAILAKNAVYLFKCDWWDFRDHQGGIFTDKNFKSINTSWWWYTKVPLVLANQVNQFFYLVDNIIDQLGELCINCLVGKHDISHYPPPPLPPPKSQMVRLMEMKNWAHPKRMKRIKRMMSLSYL